MNKTLNIGLAGFAFNIDEMAYLKLSDYLKALRNTLDANEAEEIMHDIELRIVEILKENLGKREIVNMNDIELIISKIGTPEEIDNDEEIETINKNNTKKPNNTQKELFLSPENKKIAGVCGGLAEYFEIDTIWIRLAFIIGLTLNGFGLLIYIILWIIVPKVQTTNDLLKMKGQNPNFENIKNQSIQNLNYYSKEAKEKFAEFYNENKGKANSGLFVIWKIVKGFFGIISLIITFSLIVSCIAIIFKMDNNDILSNFNFYFGDNQIGLLGLFFAILSVVIPAAIFCVIGIRLLFSKSNLKYIGYIILSLVIIWVILIAILGAGFTKYVKNYSGHNEQVENVSLNINTSDSILVGKNKVKIPSNYKPYWNDIFSDGKKIYEQDYPYIKITHKDIESPYLLIKKEAKGYNLPINLETTVKIEGNTILLPNYYGYDYKDRFRDVNVEYELFVPNNIKVREIKENGGLNLIEDEDNNSDNNYKQNESLNQAKISINGKEINIKKTHDKIKIDDDSIKEFSLKINDNLLPEISIKTK